MVFISASHSIREPLDHWKKIDQFVPSRLGNNQRALAFAKGQSIISISQSYCSPFHSSRRSNVTFPYNASAIVPETIDGGRRHQTVM
jgi:hypothetical protein